jgi:hypothetical protein
MPYVRKPTQIQMAPRSLSRAVIHPGMRRGMGQTDQTTDPWYNAGLVAGAGGTPSIDLSQGFPTAEAQATFTAGYNAASYLATAPGALQPGVATPSAPGAPSAPSGQTFSQWLAANQTTVLVAGVAIFGAILLSRMR